GFAFAIGIDAEFTEQQRFGVRDHLQSREVVFERRRLMQVNVEADEIERLRLKKFRSRIIRVRAKTIGIDAFSFSDEFIDELRHLCRTAPTYDVGRNFIRDAVRKDGGMASAGQNSVTDRLTRFSTAHRVIEKNQVLVPWNINQDQQVVLRGEIEKPAWGQMIN